MEISRRFMSLLTELGDEMDFCYNMSRLTALPRFSAGFSTELFLISALSAVAIAQRRLGRIR